MRTKNIKKTLYKELVSCQFTVYIVGVHCHLKKKVTLFFQDCFSEMCGCNITQ